MAEVVMVNRVRFTSSLQKELMPQLDQLSRETRVPKSRLLDEIAQDTPDCTERPLRIC